MGVRCEKRREPALNNRKLKTMIDQLNIEVIQAARVAIGRSRVMTTLVVIASVLATIAYWNGRKDSWTRLRYLRQYALIEVDSIVRAEMKADPTLETYKAHLLTIKGLPPAASIAQTGKGMDSFALRALNNDQLDSAEYWEIIEPKLDARFIDMLRLDTPALYPPEKWSRLRNALISVSDWRQELPQAKTYAEQLRRGYMETALLVNLPFFGVSFDLNDLALLAGLTFTLLLIALCYALIREHSTVDTVSELIDAADNGTDQGKLLRRRIYQVTAHANVLTIPPSTQVPAMNSHGRMQFEAFIDRVFKLLGLLLRTFPGVIYTLIYVNDRGTSSYGAALSPERLYSLELASSIFLVLVWIFSAAALMTNWRLETRWKDLVAKVN